MAENRVRWAFWPPGVTPETTKTEGIWIVTSELDVVAESASPSASEAESTTNQSDVESLDEEDNMRGEGDVAEDADDDDISPSIQLSNSRFGVLALNDEASDVSDASRSDGG